MHEVAGDKRDDWEVWPGPEEGEPFFNTRRFDGGLELRPIGEVDLYSTPDLKAYTDSELANDTELLLLHMDLSETTFMDGSALGYLVGCVKKFRERHGDVVLTVDGDKIRKIFNITGLENVFAIRDVSEEPYDLVNLVQAAKSRKKASEAQEQAAEKNLTEVPNTFDKALEPNRLRVIEEAVLDDRPANVIVAQMFGVGLSIEINTTQDELAEALVKTVESAAKDKDVVSITFHFPFPKPMEDSLSQAVEQSVRVSAEAGKGVRVSLGQKRLNDPDIPGQYARLLRATGQLSS